MKASIHRLQLCKKDWSISHQRTIHANSPIQHQLPLIFSLPHQPQTPLNHQHLHRSQSDTTLKNSASRIHMSSPNFSASDAAGVHIAKAAPHKMEMREF